MRGQKESGAIKCLAKLHEQEKLSEQMSAHNAADYAGLAALKSSNRHLQDEIDERNAGSNRTAGLTPTSYAICNSDFICLQIPPRCFGRYPVTIGMANI